MLRRKCFARTIKYKIARGQILIWKSLVVTAYPTQDWGTRSDVRWGSMCMGMSERSEIMRLLPLKFARQSNIPEIQIEGCLGDAIIVLMLQ